MSKKFWVAHGFYPTSHTSILKICDLKKVPQRDGPLHGTPVLAQMPVRAEGAGPSAADGGEAGGAGQAGDAGQDVVGPIKKTGSPSVVS